MQFRYGESILRMHLPGFAFLMDLAFGSDISDHCTWITPFVKEPSKGLSYS